MEIKQTRIKEEEFAKRIILEAEKEGLTIRELYHAADIAKEISDSSMVEKGSIERTEYNSRHMPD